MSNKLRLFFKVTLFFIYYILGITFIIPLAFSFLIYHVMFGKRCERTEKCITEEKFSDLVCVSAPFKSKKNKLDASFYYNKNVSKPKALIVFCHGIGCGRQNYLNRIDYFAKKGYLVFAYDLTGCVNSEGNNLKGLPQATIDLKSALLYLGTINELKSLPCVLYGHSWSAYACATLMNEGDFGVKAIVSCSGFDSSRGIACDFMNKHYKYFKVMLSYYFKIVEYVMFGKISQYSAMEGINKFNKPILIAHSKDDPSIPLSGSIFSKKAKCTNLYAQFVCFEDRGHTLSRPIEDENIVKQNYEKDSSFRKLQKKESFFKYNVDKHYDKADYKHIYSLDEKFMDDINKFYITALNIES